ncbi:hypothetical protein [Nocardia terpenica]|uniref:Uncharacterized protein n=1 Tax=Nocardia terpenica TaxID=455432 RepID=A0A164J8C2_9NOCA|nr:hypothetical protein [Nocardia terpenica]KZM70145.1 hypothetical protein AWN90_06180 [Nocardia terpenica]NQE91563.1 hypothetical protein [Nocardia terpenica]
MTRVHVMRMRWRPDAGRLVTLMAVAFGLTVVITRLYLMASGYPKIGGSTYHIAHALFGGLLLVIACMLQLMSSGRTALIWAALLSGVGLGLFIDEVGKFITSDNNYFFPLAAPIIYLAFLLTVAAARYAASRRVRSPELALGAVTEEIGRSVGARLSTQRQQELLTELRGIDPDACGPESRALAAALRDYLTAAPCETEPTLGGRLLPVARRLERRLLPLPALRVALIAVLIAHAVWSLLRLGLAGVVIAGWHSRWPTLDRMLDVTHGHGWKSMVGLAIAAAAELAVGIGCAVGAFAWLRGDEDLGVRLGIWSDVVSLTVVNVLASYFSQFLTVFTAIAEALLLWALVRYRIRRAAQPKNAAAS